MMLILSVCNFTDHLAARDGMELATELSNRSFGSDF